MSSPKGVFSIMGNTFSLWAAFRENNDQPVLGFEYIHLSDRPSVVVAVAVEREAVLEFAKYVSAHSDLVISQIDGDPKPNALWMGHWTHFRIRLADETEIPVAPPSPNQAEKFLTRILNGESPWRNKGKR
jgi:hypothetical protein